MLYISNPGYKYISFVELGVCSIFGVILGNACCFEFILVFVLFVFFKVKHNYVKHMCKTRHV